MPRLALGLILITIFIFLVNENSFAGDEICPEVTAEKKIHIWKGIIDTPIGAVTNTDKCIIYTIDINDEIKTARNSINNPLSDPLLSLTKSNFEKLKAAYNNKSGNFSKSSFDSGFLSESEYIVYLLANCFPNSNPNYQSILISEAFKIWFEAMKVAGLDSQHVDRYKRVLNELKKELQKFNKNDEIKLIDDTLKFLDIVNEKNKFWIATSGGRIITENNFKKFIEPNKNNNAFKADYELYIKFKTLQDQITVEKDNLTKSFENITEPYVPPQKPIKEEAYTPPQESDVEIAMAKKKDEEAKIRERLEQKDFLKLSQNQHMEPKENKATAEEPKRKTSEKDFRKPTTEDIHDIMGYPAEAKNNYVQPRATSVGAINALVRSTKKDTNYYSARIMSFIINNSNKASNASPYRASSWIPDLTNELFEWRSVVGRLNGHEYNKEARKFNAILELLKNSISEHPRMKYFSYPPNFDIK